MRVKVKLVALKDPCSACFIIGGLVKELLEKVKEKLNFIEVEYVELENLKNLHSIAGLEVENFPAIIINEEQITAGTIPDRNELIRRIEWERERVEF